MEIWIIDEAIFWRKDEKKQNGLKIADKGGEEEKRTQVSCHHVRVWMLSWLNYNNVYMLWFLPAIWLHHIIANQLLRERECAQYSALSWSTSSWDEEEGGSSSHWMAYFSSMALSTWTTTLNKHPQKREWNQDWVLRCMPFTIVKIIPRVRGCPEMTSLCPH